MAEEDGVKHMMIASLAAAALAGCAATGSAPASPAAAAAMTCKAEPAQYHIGHDATQAMGTAILKDSGARTLRWGPPNSAWTMDYREDRVNVRYDEAMKITDITCG
ncbi:MAG: I78 family peptidase inhibitor [Erythrobacter sp.]|uniref:I78 family peptidase inhibitor n=1 Tax=Erythrobacter sp. TaxID=1042 RepID=UPI0025F956BD|nr:I78 family peptidase inhibitor [Erythrobacter sp.]MCM0000329.1 I78 family peptidase inhibitor [Erythrobacter sp.]